jgi:hypothetical protein
MNITLRMTVVPSSAAQARLLVFESTEIDSSNSSRDLPINKGYET